MSRFNSLVIAGLLAVNLFVPAANAGVSAEDAAKLGKSLTPTGAERAGNKDGTIPPWEGGYNTVPAGWKNGDKHPDPYAADKILFTITGKDIDKHADKLSEGMKAMLRKYPRWKMNVYPTRRSFAAPQWVYDNTIKNATRAKTKDGGYSIEGAYGGTPFPIPKDGYEVMWDHLLRWQGENVETRNTVYVSQQGQLTQVSIGEDYETWPYYYKEGSADTHKGDYWMIRFEYLEPSRRNGEIITLRDPVNMLGVGRSAWQYLPGQRRTKRAPSLAFDTPNSQISNLGTYDDTFQFLGSLERYTWKLVEKKELYVPYNMYKYFLQPKNTDVLLSEHQNPDFMRWELHRVWVVEATLREGKRHIYQKRRFYVDEDSWAALLSESYDSRDTLWRTTITNPWQDPSVPYMDAAHSYVHYDLLANAYAAQGVHNEHKLFVRQGKRHPESFFSPEGISGEGVR